MVEPGGETPPQLTIQRYWDVECHVCTQMKRARTLERFVEEHPNVRIEEYDLAVPMNNEKADELDIEGIPALVWRDSDGNLLLKHEGGLTAAGMKKLYAKVLRASADGDLGVVSRGKRRRRSTS